MSKFDRRQDMQGKLQFRLWGERRDGAWVVLWGNYFSSEVLKQFASRQDMHQAMESCAGMTSYPEIRAKLGLPKQ